MRLVEDSDRLNRLLAVSKKKYGLTVQADWRYQYFFEYLQISPSYRAAHLMATAKKETLEANKQLPSDFADVMKTYQVFGDVWCTSFWDWWVKKAQYVFGVRHPPRIHELGRFKHGVAVEQTNLTKMRKTAEQYLIADRIVEGMPASIILAIPLHQNRRDILKSLARTIDNVLNEFSGQEPLAELALLKNKIHKKTLDDARKVVRARAALPKKPLYVIGNKVNLAPAYVTPEGEKLLRGDTRRQLMAIVTSRQLQRALILSENAARGKFPSFDAVDAIDFDVKELRSSIILHRDWMKAELARLKKILAKRDSKQSVSQRDA